MQIESILPVVVGIDLEPVPRHTDPRRPLPWDGVEQIHRLLSRLRGSLPAVDGRAAYSWFFRLDPQIAETYGDPAWPLKHYARIAEDVLRSGDEIGVHPHSLRWKDGAWASDHGSQEWVDYCVRLSLETLEKNLGVSCRVARMGDRWSSAATVDLLESLGVEIDMTPEPGKESCPVLLSGEPGTGALPDYSSTPSRPYHPSRHDFRIPGDEKRTLTILPLTTRRMPAPMHLACRRYHAMQVWRGVPVYSDFAASSMRVSLSLPAGLFRHLVRGHLAGNAHPYLALVLRSDVGRYPGAMRRLEANLRWLSTAASTGRVVFVRPQEALEALLPS